MARSPKSDPQREEVYKWERLRSGNCFKSAQPITDLRELAEAGAALYGLEPVPVLVANQENLDWAGLANEDQIALNTAWHGRNGRTLLHELAHWIVFQYGLDDDHAPHGPVWLGIYCWLLDWACVEPLEASLPSARHHGLKYRHPRYCAPGVLKPKGKRTSK